MVIAAKRTSMPRLRWLKALLFFNAATTPLLGALTVSTNFEGGSARVIAINADAQVVRVMPAGDPDRGWPCWWFLRADGLDPAKPLTLEVVGNTLPVHGDGDAPMKPLAANWSLPAQAAFSTNGTNWKQTAPGERQGKTTRYRLEAGATSLWLAWGPPFTWSDARTFVADAARTNRFAKAFTLARSREGRDVPALQISEGETPAARRPAIWVFARQHAWESGGTWVGIGFAEWLLGNDERAKRLRAGTEIFFVPIMDVDRVVTGDGGKQSLPQDHNRDWTPTPHWPEVAAVQQRVLALAREERMALLVDLHNPGASAKRVDLWITPTNHLGALAARNQTRLFEAVCREITTPIPVKPEPHWDGPGKGWWEQAWHTLTCTWTYEHANPHTVAITVETPWNTPSSTAEGYRAVGQGLGRAIELYFREPSK
jgi:hypothetical protein